MTHIWYSRGRLAQQLTNALEGLRAEVRGMSEAEVRACPPQELARELVESVTPKALRFDYDRKRMAGQPEQTTLQRSNGFRTVEVAAERWTLIIPFEGSPILIETEPVGTMGGISHGEPLPDAAVVKNEVRLFITVISPDPNLSERISSRLTSAQKWLDQQAEWANKIVADWMVDAQQALISELAQRVATLETNANALAALGIPIGPSAQSIPVTAPSRRLDRRQTPTDNDANMEWTLLEETYNDIVRTIVALSLAAERLPGTSEKLSEEDFRNIILFVLNANYEGRVVGEAFSGKGKTDILLLWQGRAAFIGECKIWDGRAKFRDAINQLFSYVTWRDTKTALIVFAQPSGMSDVKIKALDELRKHPQRLAEVGTERFTMRHPIDAEKSIVLSLIVVAAEIRPSIPS